MIAFDHVRLSVDPVSDEGEFWERRDMKALVEEVGEWNRHIPGFVGRLKDSLKVTGGMGEVCSGDGGGD